MNLKNAKNLLLIYVLILIYAVAIHTGHAKYLENQNFATGIFHSGKLEIPEWIIIIILLFFSIFLLPLKIDRPSVLFFYVIYLLIFVPGIVLFLGQQIELNSGRITLIASMLIGLAFISFPAKTINERKFFFRKDMPSKKILTASKALWLLLIIFIFASSYQTINFVGLSETYTQRKIGSVDINTLSGLIKGYSKTYFIYFFSPIILTFGLLEKKKVLISLGVLGFLFGYMIAAERSIFLYPFFIFIFFKLIKSGKSAPRFLSEYLILSSAIILTVAYYYKDSELLNGLGFYFFTRVIATPGQFINDYYEFFSRIDYTYWSHVRGISLLIDPPQSFKGNPLWPQLGWIVGTYYNDVDSNLNANFWATDGIAAAGPIGVIIISIIFSIYLFFLDHFSRKWPLEFIIPALFPLAFIISNGSLLTTLLSYGGFLWLVSFWFFSKSKNNNSIKIQ